MKKYLSLIVLVSLCLLQSTQTYARQSNYRNNQRRNARTSAAKTKRYKVEVLVFQRVTDQHLHFEDFPNNFVTLNTDHAITLAPVSDDASDEDFQELPSSQFSLEQQADKLTKSGQYQVLLHEAWFQDVGKDNRQVKLQGTPIKGETWLPQMRHEKDYEPILSWLANGIIRIRKNKFYAVHLNLHLNLPQNILASFYPQFSTRRRNGNNQLRQFRLQQFRRVRANELHYFDHPLFGVLLLIKPVKNS